MALTHSQQAVAYAKAATITPEQWIARVKTPGYNWQRTSWWKALKELEQAAKEPLPPRPTLQNTIFYGSVTDNAIDQHKQLPRKWRAAFSADGGNYEDYGGQLPHRFVTDLLATGHKVDAWGNQLQIGADQISSFALLYGCERVIEQAENELEAACAHADYLIGNFTIEALGGEWAKIKTQVEDGTIACTHEVYDGNPADDSTQGLPVSSFTLGVAMDEGVYYPLDYLLPKTPAGARTSICIWHGAGLETADWRILSTL